MCILSTPVLAYTASLLPILKLLQALDILDHSEISLPETRKKFLKYYISQPTQFLKASSESLVV